MNALTERELKLARDARPLPLDASWSTGDEDFDARIHATILRVLDSEKRLKAEVRRLRTFVEYVRNRVERTSPVIDFTRGGLASFALSAALRPAKRGAK